MIIVSILEIVGISLVMPFITTLIEPNLSDNYFFYFLKIFLQVLITDPIHYY